MIISVRVWIRTLKYVLVFALLSVMLYKMLGMFGEYLLPVDRYRTPDGAAIKVFQPDHAAISGFEYMAERLKLFYWYGE